MARAPLVENPLPYSEWGQLSTTFSNAAPSYSRPQPAKDNGVKDSRSN